jgi:transposase InsO family protein
MVIGPMPGFPIDTRGDLDLPVVPNLLNRTFSPGAPRRAWVADISYIPTDEGWLYLAVVLDLFSLKVVAWAMGDHMRTELPLAALMMATQRQKPPRGVIHHSDRGCQYASHNYGESLKNSGLKPSMSRKGNCWDNAPMESVFGTLNSELVHDRRYANPRRGQA